METIEVAMLHTEQVREAVIELAKSQGMTKNLVQSYLDQHYKAMTDPWLGSRGYELEQAKDTAKAIDVAYRREANHGRELLQALQRGVPFIAQVLSTVEE